MQHTLPPLPYELDALAPTLSEESLDYHYNKHHRAYVEKLNALLDLPMNQSFSELPLKKIIETAKPGPIFNNASQIWNHSFYWECLTPEHAKNVCDNSLEAAISQNFGSMDRFKTQFIEAAIGQFGSGWAWLVKNKDDSLSIETSSNAESPLQQNKTCLLTCDVWEHAYYIDYRNERASYLKAFWEIVNWQFVLDNWKK